MQQCRFIKIFLASQYEYRIVDVALLRGRCCRLPADRGVIAPVASGCCLDGVVRPAAAVADSVARW